MDFFEAQERSRRRTRTLVLVFLLATFAVSLAVTAIFGVVLMWTEASPVAAAPEWIALRAPVLIGIFSATLIFIGIASLYRVLTLRGGGARVARELGGTPVPPDTQDPMRRRLRNVVEEMAIASGVPVPEVYVLEQEGGINAFAAGYRPEDAAVAVTRGTLEQLTRDELQGVVAHEFSHVLNGDMRMNIRLMGPLFGIMVIGLIGRSILRNVRTGGRRARVKGNGVALVLIVALGLTIIGYLGVFLARLIKAAVARQREYLADASAVQFTRHPQGIAGALKKILGLADRSFLQRAEAEEVSHMLFAPGARLAGLLATHPPLEDRIQRLDKSWQAEAGASPPDAGPARPPESIGSFELAAAGLAPLAGNPGPAQLAAAHALHRHVPPRLYEAAHSNDAAFLLVLALVLHPEAMPRREQLNYLQRQLGAVRTGVVEQLYEELSRSGSAYRLPLLDLAFPALRNRPDGQLEYLAELVHHLAHQDGRVELFEYALARVLVECVHRARRPGAPIQHRRKRVSASQNRDALRTVFAALAVFGHDSAAESRAAWRAGLEQLDPKLAEDLPAELPVRPGEAGWQARLDDALEALLPMKHLERRRVVEALGLTATHDDWVSVAESELLRTFCAVLDCPLPPLYAQAIAPVTESTEALRSLSP
jgi:Zn-dependent protease with chaperone function